jgi:hypothetical protein
MEDYIFKIQHKPTGLFYCSRKGRFKDEITNLSKKGNFYTSFKVTENVFDDLKNNISVAINKAQFERYSLPITNNNNWAHSYAQKEDLIIKKYILLEVEQDK